MSNTSIRRTGIPEFSDLVLACRHRPIGTLAVGVLISMLACLAAWTLTPATFQSESFVHIRQREDVVFTQQSSRSDDLTFVRSQTQLALSPQVLTAALADEELRKWCDLSTSADGIETFRSWLRADAQTGAEILSISAVHDSADVSHAASLAVTRAYLDEVTSRQKMDQDRRRSELEAAAKNADRGLDRLWDDLNKVATQLGSNDSQSLTMRDQVQIQAYRDYAQQLRTAQTRRHELQTRLADAESTFAKAPAEVPRTESVPRGQNPLLPGIASALAAPPNVEKIRWTNRIAELDERIRQIRSVAVNPDTPRLDPYLAERRIAVDMLRSVNADSSEETSPGGVSDRSTGANPMREPGSRSRQPLVDEIAEKEISRIKQQLNANASECDFLKARMAEIDSKITQTKDQNGVQLEMARHAVERQSRLADGLWQSLEELKIESQSQPRVKLMKLADYPLRANYSKRLKTTAAAFGIGWLVTIVMFGLVEWQSCLVRHSDDVVAITSVPVFGIDRGGLPTQSTLAGGPPMHRETGEAAARLMLANARRQEIASVFVTSATNAEPREQTALKLAEAFAAYRRRTLLIDCDASSDRLAQQLGMGELPGMAELSGIPELAGIPELGRDARQAMSHVIPTEMADLDVLPRGQSNDGVSWIDPQTLLQVLQMARQQYDAIVISGPAILSSGDSLLLAAQTDHVMLSVFMGQTQWNQLRVCQDVIEATDVPLAGMILTRDRAVSIPTLRTGHPAKLRENRVINSVASSDDADLMDELQMRDHIAALQAELRQSVTAQTTAPENPSHAIDDVPSIVPHRDRPFQDPNS